ncbi:MAG TPA: YCF48-related protein [Kofleriaceae bacterium]|nr:YCF48-related protein [Kofleriaceae bacterium]
MRTSLALAALAALAACGSPGHSPATPDGPPASIDAPVDRCTAPTGTFHDQVLPLGDGLENRYYWLHVPDSYDCGAPMPLLVDFHGTASDTPEEAYQTPAITALGDQVGAIVVRPRSRSSDEGGQQVYRWDQNPGDIARNVTYADNLVAYLEQHYAIDPQRVYASGFSSGSNMAAQFLADAHSPFHGLAPIAGGFWETFTPPPLASGPRIYMSTGYRDYLWPTARDLIDAMTAAGLPADHLFVQHTGGGHDLYPWHFTELWQWLDGGVAPGGGGAIAEPWTATTLPSPADVNALALDGTTLVAAGAHGRTWRHGAAGWALDLDRGDADYTALCFGPATALVGGDYRAAFGTATAWSPGGGVPDYGMLGEGWVNAATCRGDGSVAVAGYWSAAVTANAGAAWTQLHAPTPYGVDAQMAGAATSTSGTTVLVGYFDYVARAGASDTTATAIDHPAAGDWWNAVAVAGSTFWVVGDDGGILASQDDGMTWTAQHSGTTENLYAVSFADALHGAAVGRRGTVVVTADGGATWTPRPLGEDVYLGAVYVDATTVWIAGAGGLVATSPR